ncbi:hypothetical protein FSP39_015482 [Pinctada imbricata]|uniref:Solute carrier family 23 member 2 n=1 Tax=Pinctada imbricata TaxID=66713 RepID=A0AA88YES1_PINIB|nr:hypothetical protein FSP39_015482 [Pinctada imbricata]
MDVETTTEKVGCQRSLSENNQCPIENGVQGKITQNDEDNVAEVESPLIYKTSDGTPVHLTLFFGLQQALIALCTAVAFSLIVANTVCAGQEEEFKSRLLSSTLFMNGVTTFMMTLIGVRLPLFQGASPDYVAPLLALSKIDSNRCELKEITVVVNSTYNYTMMEEKEDMILNHVQQLQGALMASGVIHFLIGATGLVGVLLRFIGPITVVPTILLVGISIIPSVKNFCEGHWGVSFLTAGVALILSLYLGHMKMPIPIWTRTKGCHVIRYPFHQVFAILIALCVGWAVSGVMTAAGSFDHAVNVTYKQFYARTDSRNYVIDNAEWFRFPYPGHFGPIKFSASAFIGFTIATLTSILDSIGDYYACAATCRVPPPPAHAVNRGIAVEGFCTFLSGAVGCGHATTTYGANIGAIGLTKVASRHIFVCAAIIYIIFGIVGKISAVFITIPNPVLGGALIIMFGVFNGVILSNLRSVDLTSTRNLSIMGLALLLGLMMPSWLQENEDVIDTGNIEVDYVIRMMLGNQIFISGTVSCFLDNTIPGTKKERGIAAWLDDGTNTESMSYIEGVEVYDPIFIPKRFRQSRVMKYLPFMPAPSSESSTSYEMNSKESS